MQEIIRFCLTYGAFETAQILVDLPNKMRLLVNYLVDEGFEEEAALIVHKYLGPSNEMLEGLPQIPEGSSRSQVIGKYHKLLLGETVAETKKRLRALKAEKLRKEQDNLASKILSQEISSKQDNSNFISIVDLGFKLENNVSLINNLEQFERIKEPIKSEKLLGVDFLFNNKFLELLTIATKTEAFIIDIPAFKKEKQVLEFFSDLLNDKDTLKITHSFTHDIDLIYRFLNLDRLKLEGFIELTNTIRNPEDKSRKVSLATLVKKYWSKNLDKVWNKLTWKHRPFNNSQLEYAALLVVLNLQIYLRYNADGGSPVYFKHKDSEALIKLRRSKSRRGGKNTIQRGNRSENNGRGHPKK